MWEERELGNVEFIPEPSDYRILSAADSATIGHQEGWRSEVLGWAPTPVPVVSRPKRLRQRLISTGILPSFDFDYVGRLAKPIAFHRNTPAEI